MIMLWMVAVALVVTGLIGIVVPGLPGAALVWAGCRESSSVLSSVRSQES